VREIRREVLGAHSLRTIILLTTVMRSGPPAAQALPTLKNHAESFFSIPEGELVIDLSHRYAHLEIRYLCFCSNASWVRRSVLFHAQRSPNKLSLCAPLTSPQLLCSFPVLRMDFVLPRCTLCICRNFDQFQILESIKISKYNFRVCVVASKDT
jgi:hypothetical protein